jgi:uncharacterized protein (DUF2147 family)
MYKRLVATIGLIGFAAWTAQAAPEAATAATGADRIVGTWVTDGGGSKIEISKKEEKYFGKIVWLKEPNTAEGKPKLDEKNPDEAHKKDPILGLELLRDFTFDGTAAWTGGKIYDPESGSTYKCTIKFNDEGKLDVRGYVGVPAFGRSTVWTRADAATDSATAAPSDEAKAPEKAGEGSAPAKEPAAPAESAASRLQEKKKSKDQ